MNWNLIDSLLENLLSDYYFAYIYERWLRQQVSQKQCYNIKTEHSQVYWEQKYGGLRGSLYARISYV